MPPLGVGYIHRKYIVCCFQGPIIRCAVSVINWVRHDHPLIASYQYNIYLVLGTWEAVPGIVLCVPEVGSDTRRIYGKHEVTQGKLCQDAWVDWRMDGRGQSSLFTFRFCAVLLLLFQIWARVCFWWEIMQWSRSFCHRHYIIILI